jgi:hypothetical protein
MIDGVKLMLLVAAICIVPAFPAIVMAYNSAISSFEV